MIVLTGKLIEKKVVDKKDKSGSMTFCKIFCEKAAEIHECADFRNESTEKEGEQVTWIVRRTDRNLAFVAPADAKMVA